MDQITRREKMDAVLSLDLKEQIRGYQSLENIGGVLGRNASLKGFIQEEK